MIELSLDDQTISQLDALPGQDHTWQYIDGYACTNIGGVWYPIHLWILSIQPWEVTKYKVTHVDGQTLNNLRPNLCKQQMHDRHVRVRVWDECSKNKRRLISSAGKDPITGKYKKLRESRLDWEALSRLLKRLPRRPDPCHNIIKIEEDTDDDVQVPVQSSMKDSSEPLVLSKNASHPCPGHPQRRKRAEYEEMMEIDDRVDL